jgi:tape measure domain-containing protein
MALSLGELQVYLTADTSKLRRAEREVDSSAKRMTRSLRVLGRVFAAAFTLDAVRRLALTADQLNVLQRRMVRFTGDVDSAEKSFKRLVNTASSVGAEIGDITSIFERFSLIRDEIGATNEQIITMTDTLAKLGAIGGSSAEETSNALRQLAQGLAGGVLRAEEFNSIIEQTPEIAKAIGEQMGLSMGEMRQAMLDGKLTSDRVFQAIIQSADKTNREFEKIPKSITQSAQALTNELIVAIGKLDEKLGASTAISDFISGLAEGFAIINETADPALVASDQLNQLVQRRITLQERLNAVMSTHAEANKVAREREIPRLEAELERLDKLIQIKRAELDKLVTDAGPDINITKPVEADPLEDLQKLTDFLSLRAELTADANHELEAEYNRHKMEILSNYAKGSKEYKTLMADLSDWRLSEEQKLNAKFWAVQQQGLANLSQVFQASGKLIQEGMKEGNAAAKAAFIAMKAIQVAQIIAATEVSAALAATTTAPAGPFAWFATAAGIRATGYASAGLVAGLTVGEAFAQGGIVGGSSTVGDNVIARVNSGEMILNKAQQGQLFAMANGGGGGGGAPNINIVNNGSPIDVEGVSMNRDEITLMINDATQKSENRINNSLSSGRGTTAQSLQKGFRAERRL